MKTIQPTQSVITATPQQIEDAFKLAAPYFFRFLAELQGTAPTLNDGSALSSTESLFITVPEVTLPDGQVVPSFRVGQYHCAKGADGKAVVSRTLRPWVNIDYDDARAACQASGYQLITETRALAIAWDIVRQDINWTGGKAGKGSVYQGLHKGNVNCAQAGDYESPDPEERRWHQLSNGEKIYDVAGNIWTWVFNDVLGDEVGICLGIIAKDSISLQAPYPSMKKGMGYIPAPGDYSDAAFLRGGYWNDGANSGPFTLYLGNGRSGPYASIGFRCTCQSPA